ncbi:MAG: hypothetical protein HWN68_11360 [Desulfobacterales bacterium]|nr:hypothetical protein [Desulfobacterales bacterium]
MTNRWLVGLLLVSCMFLVGMGGLGGSAPIKAPEPATNYAATITDQSHISTRVEKFSVDGRTAISGRLGAGRISIRFDKISSVGFVLRDKTLRAEVLLKDGKTVPLIVDKGTACYGKLAYGDFKITMEDIRSITIHGEVGGQ